MCLCMSVRHETYLRMRDWNKAPKELEADGPRPNRSGVSAALFASALHRLFFFKIFKIVLGLHPSLLLPSQKWA